MAAKKPKPTPTPPKPKPKPTATSPRPAPTATGPRPRSGFPSIAGGSWALAGQRYPSSPTLHPRQGQRRPGPTATGPLPVPMAQPPVGTYDPALDAQAAAAQRGYGDLQADYETGNLRDTVDYGLGRDAIGRDYGRNSADLGTQLQRGLGALGTDYRYGSEDLAQTLARGTQDLGTARTQGQEDYGSNVAMLQRQYRQLGGQQQQQQNAAGVLRGGAALQAAAKRAENESLDRQPIDTSFNRFLSGNTLQQGRLGEDVGRGQTRLTEGYNTQTGQLNEDYATQTGRLGEDRDLALASLALGLAPPDASNPLGGRSFQDRTTALTRAGRENTEFGQDVNAQRFYQAAQGGWNPPPLPEVAAARPAPRGFPSVTGGSWALAGQRQAGSPSWTASPFSPANRDPWKWSRLRG